MKLAWLIIPLVALGACDKPKPRPDRGLSPAATASVAPIAGPGMAAQVGALSNALLLAPQTPGFTLDVIGAAADPLNRKPAVTPAGTPTVFSGFGYDPVTKSPATGVDLAIDGKLYGTAYGFDRPDVAAYTKLAELVSVGFKATLPADALTPGPHSVVVRVIGSEGDVYYASPAIAFTVR